VLSFSRFFEQSQLSYISIWFHVFSIFSMRFRFHQKSLNVILISRLLFFSFRSLTLKGYLSVWHHLKNVTTTKWKHHFGMDNLWGVTSCGRKSFWRWLVVRCRLAWLWPWFHKHFSIATKDSQFKRTCSRENSKFDSLDQMLNLLISSREKYHLFIAFTWEGLPWIVHSFNLHRPAVVELVIARVTE
jgi:hypothetical protein